VTTFKCQETYCRKIDTDPLTVGPTDSNIEIEYGVGGCASGCPSNVAGCTDSACNPTTGDCDASTVLSRCEQKRWQQVMEWNFGIDMPSMVDGPDPDTLPDGTRAFQCTANPNMADYTVLPSSLNSASAMDPNNFKTAKTVSPAVQVNLSLPAKN
jgi:hypothetical protein